MLWLGVLAGPVTWLIVLQTNYLLSYVACEQHRTWFVYATIAAGTIVVAVLGAIAWRSGSGAALAGESVTPPVSGATCDTRARWMSQLALVSSVWFIVVILAMAIPIAVLEPCQ